ncbi:MAG: hypothetical protein FDZ70_05985 [Actinobacteria bacterium]|nr:MAG: hypothetical protein FDZ70_05985 [Actinomycetota bacterium]
MHSRTIRIAVVVALAATALLASVGIAGAAPVGPPPGPPPGYAPDEYTTPMNTPLVISDPAQGLFGNDTHVGGQPWGFGQLEAFLWGELGPTGPTAQGGSITDWDRYAGTFTYTPPADFTGVDTVHYNRWDRLYDVWSGPHVLTLNVGVDELPEIDVEQNDPAVVYSGTWSTLARSQFSGGSATYSEKGGSSASISFNGTGIDWISARTTSAGKAKVYLDEVLVATVDLYRSPNLFQQTVYSVSGLDNGPHTLRIVNAGGKNPSSSGIRVWVDRFHVTGTLSD